MTNEEMASELLKAGWRVQPPITQANCKHERMTGSVGLSYDGSGSSESFCSICGLHTKYSWGPRTTDPIRGVY